LGIRAWIRQIERIVKVWRLRRALYTWKSLQLANANPGRGAMKPSRTRAALLIAVLVLAAPMATGCATAVPADPVTLDATAVSTVFDVQAGSASDTAGEFVATLLAGMVVALFLAGIGAAYSAWTD
jgi:hypothetical protein